MEDNEILELYRNGEQQQALNLIMRKYGERLYWHIRKLTQDHDDTDDLLQNTFVKAWKSLDSFREDSKMFTWLYRIATNETLNYLKKKQLRATLSLSSQAKEIENRIIGDKYFSGDTLQLALQKAIAKLPPKQKAVFNMRYFDELKYEEISEIMDISVGSLKASYHHAFNKVQASIKEELDIE